MTTVLSPSPWQRFVDNSGQALVGGKLFTYAAGTTTKAATYTDSTGNTPNSNPVILDSRGEALLWIPPNVAYKYTLAPAGDTDPPTNPIKTVDNVVVAQLTTLYGGVDTGAVNAYALSFVANFTALSDGIIIFWIPASTNTGASTINVNGLGVVPIKNGDGTALSQNEIQANLPAQIIYKSGNWILGNPAFPSYFSSGSFTATVFGCTTAPTKTVTWAKSGKIIVLNVPQTGALTSNATSFGMSGLPPNLWVDVGAAAANVGGIGVRDNGGAYEAGMGDVFISPTSGIISFDYKGGVWTNINSKFFGPFVIVYFTANNFS